MQIGLFEKLRSLGIYANDTDYFNITSVQYLTTNGGYCRSDHISGTDAKGIFDGNELTAWASINENTNESKYVILEFIKAPLYVNGYKFKVLCGPPKELLIEGSIDGTTWFEVDNRNPHLSDYTSKTYKVNHPSIVKYLNFSVFNEGRFHIGEIELYGPFDSSDCTLRHKRVNVAMHVFLMALYS
jgi:hypothetical protein